MRKLVFLFSLFFIFNVFSLSLSSDVNLVELKKQEEERRKKTKKSKAVVNLDYINKIKSKGEKYSIINIKPSIKPLENEGKDKKDTKQKKRDPQKTEEYWRNLKNNIEKNIIKLEGEIKKQESELNRLRTRHLITDLPLQKRAIKAQMDELLDLLNQNKENLKNLRNELEMLRERARKAGVPPGWIR